ncbi:2Fe-2S iron-sulfur cluster-binding protein [Sphingobacterium arenae]|uniref:(2Fe-2S)-binding protein n=1 Tax=Sphingobacterium arenae TaxID=1280598 RepID=A0ABR7Y7S7_9SPHI|nr:2Fe-2S iron-sulfur cluster-binding protein [Sphingobacterium arenae]MBD1427370.1 (2Fe-2S)-binding protein [Sphingobacterium arenae]
MADEKFKITIDGIPVEVAPGTTILNAARQIGGDIVPPAMCYYSTLEGSGGKCRTCLVKVSKGSEKDPRPMPKLVASCRTTVMDGMEVQNITSPDVLDARKGVVEMLLINHPLDCPVCDQAGECKLQDLSYEHGLAETRYAFKRRTFERIDIGDKIQLHMNRCILCYRCVFVADQLTEKREHGIIHRGDHAEISTFIENALDSDFIGNVIDVCPVGALTDKTFRFKSRVWFSKPVDAHRDCPTCSGKVTLWYKGEEVLRVTGRKDEYNEVKEFICDTCRFEKKKTADWVLEEPTPVSKQSVIDANHYGIFNPPPVIKENTRLQEANEEQLARTERLK